MTILADKTVYAFQSSLDALYAQCRKMKMHRTNQKGEMVFSNKDNVVYVVWNADRNKPDRVTIEYKVTKIKRHYVSRDIMQTCPECGQVSNGLTDGLCTVCYNESYDFDKRG